MKLIFRALVFSTLLQLFVSSSDCLASPVTKKIKIGILIPDSGSFAPLGNDSRQGIEAAMVLGGFEQAIEPVYADSKSDPTTSISEFRKLISSDGVLGSYAIRSPVGMAINPISKNLGIPVLGGVGDQRFAEQNDYAYLLWSRADEEGRFIANKILEHGFHNAAVVTLQDDWTTLISDEFRKVYSEKAKIEIDQTVLPQDNDFRTIVSKIKSKKVEVIFLNVGLIQIGPFIRQIREQKIEVPIYSNYWAQKKEVVQSAGEQAVEGVRLIEMDTNLPHLKEFLEKRYGTNPSGATLSAYSSMMLLGQVLNRNPQISNSKELYALLNKENEIVTPDARYAIRNRCVQFPLVEREIKNGKAQTVGD